MKSSAKPEEQKRKALRRVVIEERQRKVLEHARLSQGYAEDLDPHAHDRDTFRLINQRRDLDELPEADYVVPALDEWKHWIKMNDWGSRNLKLEQLTGRLRRKEASQGEVQFLVTVCRPVWADVAANLRRYGGVDSDPGAAGIHQREGTARANELDRDELDAVIQSALMEALVACPRPFPRGFFPWLKKTLSHRALDYVLADLTENDTRLPHDDGIRAVLDRVLSGEGTESGMGFSVHGDQRTTPSGFAPWICRRSSIWPRSMRPTPVWAARAEEPWTVSPIVSARSFRIITTKKWLTSTSRRRTASLTRPSGTPTAGP